MFVYVRCVTPWLGTRLVPSNTPGWLSKPLKQKAPLLLVYWSTSSVSGVHTQPAWHGYVLAALWIVQSLPAQLSLLQLARTVIIVGWLWSDMAVWLF